MGINIRYGEITIGELHKLTSKGVSNEPVEKVVQDWLIVMGIKIKMKDVEFTKCEEYNPMHPKANSMGMRKFWRADYCGETIVTLCDTKAECVQEVRRLRRK